MWPWMQQNFGGFSPMYGMGGGYGQQMGGAAPWGGMQPQYQPPQQPMQGAAQGDARIDKLKGRVNNLQEQWKGADTTSQAAIQGRIDQMQGRIKGLRQDRRQGEGQFAQPAGGAQPEPGMGQNFAQYSSGMPMGGFNPWGSGMNFGGMPWGMPNMGQYRAQMEPAMYNPNSNQGGAAPQAKAPTSVPPMKPQQPQPGWTGGPTAMGGNSFNSPFGDLVLGSTGNNNVFQKNGGSGNDLYHYDPTAGWKHMTADEYKGYGDYNYADPRTMGAAAGQKMQNWTMKNGMWQGQVGTGAYA